MDKLRKEKIDGQLELDKNRQGQEESDMTAGEGDRQISVS